MGGWLTARWGASCLRPEFPQRSPSSSCNVMAQWLQHSCLVTGSNIFPLTTTIWVIHCTRSSDSQLTFCLYVENHRSGSYPYVLTWSSVHPMCSPDLCIFLVLLHWQQSLARWHPQGWNGYSRLIAKLWEHIYCFRVKCGVNSGFWETDFLRLRKRSVCSLPAGFGTLVVCLFLIKCFSASNEIVIEFSFICMCWPIQTGFLNFRNIRSMSWKPLLPNIIPAYLLMQLHKREKQKYKNWEEESKPTATDRWCACVSRKPKKIN